MNNYFNFSEERCNHIANLFATMNRSNGTESTGLAMDWLNKHFNPGFVHGGWVNGEWILKELPDSTETSDKSIHKVTDHFSGKELFNVEIPSRDTLKSAARNSFLGFEKWSSLSSVDKSKNIYNIGKNIEKNLELFAVVESLSSGKHLHKTRSKDVPNLIQAFYNDSASAFDCSNSCWETGVVCVIAEEYNNPLMSISWRISSILASGNSVLLLVDVKSCLSAFLLAEICSNSGLPHGVLNVFPIQQDSLSYLPKVSKVVFTGSMARSLRYIQLCASLNMHCDVLIPRRTVVLVYSDADLHAAVNSVLEILAFNDTRSSNAGCKVFYQDAVQEEFLKLLKERFERMLMGNNFSNADLSCIVTEQQKKQLDLYIAEEKKLHTELVLGPCIDNLKYSCYRPVLLCNPRTSFKKTCNEVAGPVVLACRFRTIKESIAMINHDKQAPAVSVWTERVSVSLEVANTIKSGIVWINSQNVYGSPSIYHPVYLSESSAEGGEAGLIPHLSIQQFDWVNSFGTDKPQYIYDTESISSEKSAMKVYEMYIGGTLQLASDKAIMLVKDQKKEPHAYVAGGSNSDIKLAISSGLAAQSKWQTLSRSKRKQVLVCIAENLQKNKKEFAAELQDLTGNTYEVCIDEVAQSVNTLHLYATLNIGKFNTCTLSEETSVQILQQRIPLGIVGIQCPDENPLLSFLSLVLPAFILGNAVVVIPSEQNPVPALKMCQIFKVSGVPPGIINVVSGSSSFLLRQLCLNPDLSAIWLTSLDGLAFASDSCKNSFKKVYHCDIAWMEKHSEAQILKFVIESTYNKIIYIPFGEVFSN